MDSKIEIDVAGSRNVQNQSKFGVLDRRKPLNLHNFKDDEKYDEIESSMSEVTATSALTTSTKSRNELNDNLNILASKLMVTPSKTQYHLSRNRVHDDWVNSTFHYIYTFIAPSMGKLGLVIETGAKCRSPTVYAVKDYSPLFGMIQTGDIVLKVNYQEVRTNNLLNIISF